MSTAQVLFFAQLQEDAGRGQAEVVIQAGDTPSSLYARLRPELGLSLCPSTLRVSVNERFAEWDHTLQAGDCVAYLPPMSGG